MKTVVYSLLAILIAIALFALWYKATYSMGIAASYEINDPMLERRVLIATQESPFKHALVDEIVKKIKDAPSYIRVIDVSELDGVKPQIWTAIVIIHTWEIGVPEEHTKAFVERAPHENLIVVTTSGGGDEMIEGVDAISSASRLGDEPQLADKIVERIQKLLNK